MTGTTFVRSVEKSRAAVAANRAERRHSTTVFAAGGATALDKRPYCLALNGTTSALTTERAQIAVELV